MVSMTRQDFLNFVQCYIQADPEAAAHVADYLQRGLRAALQESNRRASDMEAALIVLLEKRIKGRNEFLKTILNRWKGKTSLNLERYLEHLN